MSTHTKAEIDPVAVNMESSAVHDSAGTAKDIGLPSTAAASGLELAATSTEVDVTHHKSSTDSLAKMNPTTGFSPLFGNTFVNNGTANAQHEAANTTLQSTAPVPVVYPPRRPNIFRTRQKHVRFPVSGLNAVTPYNRTVGDTTQELEEADGFPVADMEEFQREVKERMQKKTAAFINKVRQNAAQKRQVEDLGELFVIEE
ncbi:hypothetical protein B0T20DRAFT_487255 [Sordaria brevicollis]|uniref:Uncharacterized protein n=1 Tax=Sordaria brevicollis TaxID=83679 RepID=A0AAE0PA13_SORBR|nr:hypothetical protein B0T20DRAFT_487255 [Sordaria brevicollis]